MPPGPAIGRALAEVRAAVLDGRVGGHDEQLALALRIARRGRMSDLELIEVATGAPARAVFTTRRGGVSTGGFAALDLGLDRDDPDDRVRENRARVCAALGIDPERVAMGRQVHGAGVREVSGGEGGFLGHLRDWPEGDGLVTATPGTALVVLGADCLPVAMWRRDVPRVAAAHAGWRGLVAGVLESTVAALGAPGAAGAAIGPGIGPCCYPVSAEVREAFAERFGQAVVVGGAVDLAGRRARRPRVGRGARRGDHLGRRLHLVRPRALLLVPARRRGHRPPGRGRLAGGRVIDADRLREVLAETRRLLDEAAARGGPAGGVRRAGAGRQVPAGRGRAGADRRGRRGGGGEPAPGPPGQVRAGRRGA